MSEPTPSEPFGDPPPGLSGPPGGREEEIDLAKVHGSILREHHEPLEGREPVPLWLVGVFMALVFWGGLYLAYYSGGFRADAFNPRHGMAGPAVDLNDPATMGQRIFGQNCVLCHQASGLGVPGIYPPLAGSEWVLGQGWHGDNHLVGLLLDGLQGPVEVANHPFNNAMPPWKMLRDDEIAAVLTYVRGQWGNHAPPITAAYVAKVRAQVGNRSQSWAANELEAIPADLPVKTPPPKLKVEDGKIIGYPIPSYPSH